MMTATTPALISQRRSPLGNTFPSFLDNPSGCHQSYASRMYVPFNAEGGRPTLPIVLLGTTDDN